MCFSAHIFLYTCVRKLLRIKREEKCYMKKFNILTIAALSMVVGLLGGCKGGKDEPKPQPDPDPVIPDVFEEASLKLIWPLFKENPLMTLHIRNVSLMVQ